MATIIIETNRRRTNEVKWRRALQMSKAHGEGSRELAATDRHVCTRYTWRRHRSIGDTHRPARYAQSVDVFLRPYIPSLQVISRKRR